jgi:hypothetical protein
VVVVDRANCGKTILDLQKDSVSPDIVNLITIYNSLEGTNVQ